MAITLTASNVPTPQAPSGLKKISDAYSAEPMLLRAYTLATGDPTAVPSKWNANAQLIELLARYGPSGVFSVVQGLTLSVVSGLTVQVAAGHAMMESLIELSAATNITVADNAQQFIWLKQDGTLEARTGTSAPAIDAVLLGAATAAGGTVSGTFDYSGVMKVLGMSAIRETGDTNYPGDTPNALLTFFTKTQGGLFFWDGAQYLKFDDGFGASLDTIPAGRTVQVASGEQVQIFDTLTNSGTLSVAGKLRVTE
jgi:hypothetical protein